MFDVSAFAKEVGVRGNGCGWAMIFRGPLQLGGVNVLAIEGADPLLRGRDGVAEAGNRYCRQQTDDGDDNHDFDEGESGSLFGVHVIPDVLWFDLPCVAGGSRPAVDDKVHRFELWDRKKVSPWIDGDNGLS